MMRRQAIGLLRQLVRYTSDDASSAGRTKQVFTGDRGINKVTLLGRAGRDAEVRGTDQNPVSLFPLATSQSFLKPDGTYEQVTEWHRIAIFRPGLRDVVADRVKKGDRVYVSGMIKYSSYSPSENDPPVQSTTIIGDDVMIVSKKDNATNIDEIID